MAGEVIPLIILGANGFVGQNVLESLSERTDVSVKKPTSRELNLLNQEKVYEYFKEHVSRDTSVLICAARTPYSSNPKDDFEAMFENISQCRNIINALQFTGCAEIVFLSTIDIYGTSTEEITEASLPNPESNYAAAKLASEFVLRSFAKKNNIPLLILRLSQIYGESDNSPKLIPSLIQSSIRQGKMNLTGNGGQLRDFVNVRDAAIIISKAIGRKISDVANLVTGKSITVKEVAEIITEVLDNRIEIFYMPSTKPEFSLSFDSTKILNLFEIEFSDFKSELSKIVRGYEGKAR